MAGSDGVCQLPAHLASGSVLTGVSEAGTAHIARGEEPEESLEARLRAMSYPSWRGSEVALTEERWAGLRGLDLSQSCGLQEAP